MDRSIGIVHYGSKIREIVYPLLVLGRAYEIPVYAYNISDIDPSKENPTVPAQFWNGREMAVREIEVPVYSECMVLPKKEQALPYISSNIYDWLTEHTLKTDNPGINKSHLPQILLPTAFSPCIIPTYEPGSYENLLTLGRIVPRAIVKPKNGRKGMGVLHVDKDGRYLQVQTKDGIQALTEEFWDSYRQTLERNRLGVPILQPRLNFTLDAAHALDFRLLVARGGNGDWQTVDIYARVGSSSLVSNVSQGGFICTAQEALETIAKDRAEALLETLHVLAAEIPPLIQSYRKKPIACLGLDVGIDRDTLQPYLLEANTLPGAKYHLWPLSEVKVQYYRYLLSQI